MGLSKSFSVQQVMCNMNYVDSFSFDLPRMADVPLFDITRRSYMGRSLHGTTDISNPALAPSLLCGEWIPEELLGRFPREIKAVRARAEGRSRPAIKQDVLEGCLLVSEECRVFMESVEPGRHQFIPVTLEALSGEKYRFFFFNCMNWVPTSELFDLSGKAIDGVVPCEIVDKARNTKFPSMQVRYNAKPPLRKEHFLDAVILVEGVRAVECRPSAIGGSTRYFCRGEFREKFKETQLRGFLFSKPYVLK